MKYHTLFFEKLRNMSQNLSSAAVVIGALRVNCFVVCLTYCKMFLAVRYLHFIT